MDDRPTVIERAFALANSGQFETVDAIRKQLKGEGYTQGDRQLSGGSIQSQLRKLLAAAKAKP